MKYKTVKDVYLNEPLVHVILLHRNGSLGKCVVALANQVNELQARILELDAIAPRKVRLTDGRTVIWRCPDALVPER